MALIRFPDPRRASPEGVIAIGGPLDADNLIHAYTQGIFPWPVEGLPLLWFCPPERAILEFEDLHVPRSLAREQRRTRLQFTIDRNFRAVIAACALVPRAHEEGTWITPDIVRAYCELHRRGRAHSVEAWDDGALVGGIYGVDAGGAFAGESMFHLRPNASKLALLFLIEHLAARGLTWMDIQVMTPHMSAFGAKEVGRGEFLRKLSAARSAGLKLFDDPSAE